MAKAGAMCPIRRSGACLSSRPLSCRRGAFICGTGERLLLRGGGWFYGSLAGLAALDLGYSRVLTSALIGFRPAFA